MEQAIAAHDWGAVWDLLTSTGQAAMTRDDYIKVVGGCPKIVALPQVTSIVMNAAGTTATVTVTAPVAQGGHVHLQHGLRNRPLETPAERRGYDADGAGRGQGAGGAAE